MLNLYVHPSVLEPFGIAILEAMASRKCVVASRVEGIPEIIVEGETGFLAEPEDPGQLAQVICNALADETKLQQMGESGRRRVEDIFSIEATVRAYQNLYRGIADL